MQKSVKLSTNYSSEMVLQNMKPWHRLLEASVERLKFRCVRQFHDRREWKTCCVYFLENAEKKDSYWNRSCRNRKGTCKRMRTSKLVWRTLYVSPSPENVLKRDKIWGGLPQNMLSHNEMQKLVMAFQLNVNYGNTFLLRHEWGWLLARLKPWQKVKSILHKWQQRTRLWTMQF